MLNRGELEARLDPKYYHLEKKTFFDKLKTNSQMVQLRKIIKEGSYGILPPGDCYDHNHPITFVRATDLKDDFQIDFQSANKVPQEYFGAKRSRLRQSDILIAVKGATIASAKSVGFVESVIDKTIINGSIFRFQVQDGNSAQFIAFMLSLEISKKQMRYNLVANNAVDYLDKGLIGRLLIYLPNSSAQHRIVDHLKSAYARKRDREAQAQTLLASIDSYLLGELGVTLPPEPDNTIQNRLFHSSLRQVSGGRFDPISLSRERVNAIDALQAGRYALKRLHSVADFPKIILTTNVDLLPYLGLENVQSHTGFYVETSEKESFGSALMFSAGQILFPKLRPYLNKVHYAEFTGLCSTEFVIIQSKPVLSGAFLAEFLRSRAVLAQTKYLSSGNTLPRLQTEDTRKLLIPVLPLHIQEEIVETVSAVRQQAQALRAQAQREFSEAKQAIERLILG